ncbi:hypothetical protein [Nesterenkonia xinjiangensis]|uniref:Uncharacterized protein n=1 Tax=Nesterenkonia xinjiangensis TaxID=225327 RepID=A0A7Z0GQQ1_9MICC|nr:hypothetical protein [Nesterenkonia xinjiangensis]
MIIAATVLLLLAAVPAGASLPHRAARPSLGLLNITALAQLALLAAAALCALQVSGVDDGGWRPALVIAATAAACLGGSGVSVAVLDTATRFDARPHADQGPPVLRGGAWIGLLERLAVVSTLLMGWPEGLAVVLAVKGLARYSELKQPNGAAERFIIGTFCSVLWASACAGVATLGLMG